ncbi:MAG: SDR family NAD(P)-dependent oxidoreductase, partial [Rhizobiales bacterium]|nr:SDR family NAD(P)-dependent oxidoreductase [Hyphomicrobiales bacterium]
MEKNLFNLSGRHALITGSSQGIGYALAHGLANAGAKIIINGRDKIKLADAAKCLRDKGATVFEACFDVTDYLAVKQQIAKIELEVGAIDILVNNAGMQYREKLESFPEDVFDNLLQTNIKSVFNV